MNNADANVIEMGDGLWGRHIREILMRAAEMADREEKTVAFTFNGTRLLAHAGEGYEGAKQRAEETLGFEVPSAEESARRAKEDLERMKREYAEAITQAGVMTEAEMCDAEVPWPKSADDLSAYIASLVERPHDYGTCVYAMSMAATAAFYYVAHALGTTGFQASCADLDILRRTRGWKWGKLLNYEELLYPQSCNDEHFPTWRSLIAENRERLAEKACALLMENEGRPLSDEVRRHWQWLASLAPTPSPEA